jgi:hypothetical protein
MSRSQTLGAFLGHEEPCATFHDAELLSLVINYERRDLVLEWVLSVGNPDSPSPAERERKRRGRLCFTGLCFWVLDPPGELLDESGLPWLTSDGALADAQTDTARRLAGLLPAGASGWYLFFSGSNAFAYCGAKAGAFEWLT